MEMISGFNWLEYGALGFASIVTMAAFYLMRSMLKSNERLVSKVLDEKDDNNTCGHKEEVEDEEHN